MHFHASLPRGGGSFADPKDGARSRLLSLPFALSRTRNLCQREACSDEDSNFGPVGDFTFLLSCFGL